MQTSQANEPVLAKRYARRRLYRPDITTCLTRTDLIAMARRGERFAAVDAETGEDITSSLLPIIIEH